MLLFVIFVAVVGSMLTGLATPTASAAVGGLASVLVAMTYRPLSLEGVLKSLSESLKFSGATHQLAQLVIGNDMLSPSIIILGMLVLIFAMP